MNECLPGTVLTVAKRQPEAAEELLRSLFLTGGLVLSQVSQVTGLEPYTVQNWVKRGFLAPPERKKYSRRQLSRVIIINMLKNALTMDQICQLISYVNGQLDDESDGTIDDSVLYSYFLRLIWQQPEGTLSQSEGIEDILPVLEDFTEPVPGAKEHIAQVLAVMRTAWAAATLRERAEQMMKALCERG